MKKKKLDSTYTHKEIYDDKKKYCTPKINDLKIQNLYYSKKKVINLNNIEIKSSCNNNTRQYDRSKTNSKNKKSLNKNIFPKIDEINQRNSAKSDKFFLKNSTCSNNSSSRKKKKSDKNYNSGNIKIKKIRFFEKQTTKPLKILILKHKFDRSNIENSNKTVEISIKNVKRSNLAKKYFQENEDKTRNIDDSKLKFDTNSNFHNLNNNSNYYFINSSLKAENKYNKIKLSLLPKAAIDISQTKQNKRYKNMSIVFNCDDVINFGIKLKHQNLTPEMIKEVKELDTVISNLVNEYDNINKA